MYVDDVKLAGKKQNIKPTWKILMKDVDFGEPTSFFDNVYLGCTQRECQMSKSITEICSNLGFLLGPWQNFLFPGNRMRIFPHGPRIWKVMQRIAWKDIANWRTTQLNNSTKYLLHALMTIISKKKKWDLLENCLKFAHKLF